MAPTHPALSRFVEQHGLLAEGEGLPRIAGKIVAYLAATGEPASFGTLARALGVSRGSVSGNTRLLESLGAIERTTEPGRRGDFYRITADPFGRCMERQLVRLGKMLDNVSQCRRQLPASMSSTKVRLAAMERFYRQVLNVLGKVAAGQHPIDRRRPPIAAQKRI
jgi:DNA-binding transcriptional regulator GbsR (MarR family)